jgi:4-amino-4-deoxy-L-arabinose transferase-like glycosyltransferase
VLLGYAAVLFSFPLAFNRTLSTHETVHCVNVREMLHDGDWVIPHYGGRPWLERPPLPFWLTLPLVRALGEDARVYRLAPLLVALGGLLLAAWAASWCFGRGVGLLTGLILATVREFNHYAVAPECDMFLCGVVTAAMALFAHLEFRLRPAPAERGFLWGRRPWAVLGFFVLLGLANLVKGLCFGDLLVVGPVAAFLLLGPDRWARLRRYVWLPGWLAFALVGSAWALSAYRRYPDIVDLWLSDYLGRFNQGYMREPAWYYVANLPWSLFPWTPAAFFGLWLTRRQALRGGASPERFLWCWALTPVVLLSCFQGKHHHYLLHAMVPWAVLAALGGARLLQLLPTLPWLRSFWPTLCLLVVPGEVALACLAPQRLPAGVLAALLVAWPAGVAAYWYVLVRMNRRQAAVVVFALLVGWFWAGYLQPVLLERRYDGDLAFLRRLRERVPADAPLLVLSDKGPLDASWLLWHLHGRGRLLHNLSFLKRQPAGQDDLYLVARQSLAGDLGAYGTAAVVAASERSRDQTGPDDRYFLYRVRLHDRLARRTGPVYISPMQATGRARGPEL